MSYHALNDAQRMASTYAEQLAGDLEAWKHDHDLVRKCWDLEDKLTLLNTLMGYVVKAGAKWLVADSRPQFPGIDENQHRVAEALRELDRSCAHVDDAIAWFENQPLRVEGADEFRFRWRAVQEILRIANLEENPRPVTVDELGYLVEATGDRFIMPGLDPASVQAGLEDVEAGRIDSLPDREAEGP